MIKYLIIFVLFFTSCSKKTIKSTSDVYNFTNHKISLWFYKHGNVASTDSLVINAYSSVQLGEGVEYPSTIESKYFDNAMGDDSLVVVFDNTYKVTHYYTILPKSLRNKHYLYSSKRHIRNTASYELSTKQGRKYINKDYAQYNYYKYTFTEQDYLDAKP